MTLVGDRVFGVRLDSQGTARGKVDWREAQRRPRGQPSDLRIERVSLPADLETRCRRLLTTLGLVWGAIDLVETPQGDHVFIEVNPAGQFLWIDSAVDLPILDATASLLMQGRSDFLWDEGAPSVRYPGDLEEVAALHWRKAQEEHPWGELSA